ncbi:MAG: TVP38/TMEM64 family protein [Polyangiaceae bacterium]|nr:TVP38/TMEM64 family protein [Polyangiaceae bacterium]
MTSAEPARAVPRWLVAIAGIALVAGSALFVVYHEPIVGFFGDAKRVREWVDGFGPAAPIVIIFLTALQVIVAPIPGQVAGMAAGYLFGTGLGTLYTMLGLVIGSGAAMLLARRLGRPWVQRFVDPERLEHWDHVAQRWGPAVFFLAFFVPGLPDDLLCFVIGLSGLRLGQMLVLATIGRFPGMVGAAFLGANAGELPSWTWGVAIGGGLVVTAVLFFFGERVEKLSLALGNRLGRRGRD